MNNNIKYDTPLFLGVTKFVKESSVCVVSRRNDRMYNLREIDIKNIQKLRE